MVPSSGAGQLSLERFVPAPAGSTAALMERYWAFFKKKWWILPISIVVGLGPAIAYVRYWPVKYTATSRMWVSGRISLQEGAVYDEQPQAFTETQAGLLQSDTIERRAIARLRQMPELGMSSLPEGEQSPFKLRVTQLRGSGLLELKAKGPTGAAVCAYLNALMDEFLQYKKEARAATSGDTYASLSEQIARQQVELKDAQEKLTSYSRASNVAVLEQQAQAASAYLSQLLTQLSQLRIEYQLAEAASNNAAWAGGFGTNLMAFSSGGREGGDHSADSGGRTDSLRLLEDLEKLKITRSRLSRYLRPQHPKIVQLDEEITRDEQLNDYYKHLSQEQLATLRQNLKMKIEAVQETIKEWESKVSAASERIAEFQRLRSNVERVQAVHERLLGLLQSVDMGKNLDRETLSILDRPVRAKQAKLPAPLILFMAVFMGLGTGAGVIFLMARMSDIVTSVDELQWHFEEWIVGHVPELLSERKRARLGIEGSVEDEHGFAESYRNIRSAIMFGTNPQEKRKVLLVTSSIPNEGKTTVSSNLARTLAHAGSRVLLVDGDLRCGRLHECFQMASSPGLAELLVHGGDLKEVVERTSVANLFLLPRGTSPVNPGELFLNSRLDPLLAQGRKDFDYIVIDSVPVFAADDTTSLAPRVDGVLFVIRDSFVGAATIRRALALLYERQATVLGLVFNRAKGLSSPRYYRYDKYYSRPGSAKLAHSVVERIDR